MRILSTVIALLLSIQLMGATEKVVEFDFRSKEYTNATYIQAPSDNLTFEILGGSLSSKMAFDINTYNDFYYLNTPQSEDYVIQFSDNPSGLKIKKVEIIGYEEQDYYGDFYTQITQFTLTSRATSHTFSEGGDKFFETHFEWSGEADALNFKLTRDGNYLFGITQILVTCEEASPTPTEVGDYSTWASLSEGAQATFTTQWRVLSQSADRSSLAISDVESGKAILAVFETAPEQTFNTGEILNAGFSGTKAINQSGAEVLSVAAEQNSSFAVPRTEPIECNIADIASTEVGTLIQVKKVTMNTTNSTMTSGNTTVALDNVMGVQYDNTRYNITGIVSVTSAAPVVIPIAAQKYIMTDVDEVKAASDAHVVAGEGEIRIIGNWTEISVYDASARLVARNAASIACMPGVYFVKVDAADVVAVTVR